MPNPYKQTATWWSNSGTDGFGGNVFASPQLIYVRWEDRQEDFIQPDGETAVSRAIISVPKETALMVKIGDYIFLGEASISDPTLLLDCYSIRQKSQVNDIRNVRTEARLIL